MSDRIGLTDTVIKPILVEPEGAKREYTISDFICMPNGLSIINTFHFPYVLLLSSHTNYTPPSSLYDDCIHVNAYMCDTCSINVSLARPI